MDVNDDWDCVGYVDSGSYYLFGKINVQVETYPTSFFQLIKKAVTVSTFSV